MKPQNLLTRKTILIASSILALAIGGAGYIVLRRPPRAPMERYAPAGALAFVEIDNLGDLARGLTGTTAWRELAPELGLSSQLRDLGLLTDVIGRTGIGPDEAVIAARAQYAVVLTGLEAQTGTTDDGPYIHFKPRIALVAETHSSPETAARVVRERSASLAERIYLKARPEVEDYMGVRLMIFNGPEPERQLVAASAGSVVLIGNHTAALKSCLDSIAGRAPNLGADAALKEMRPRVDHNGSIFAYVPEAGLDKFMQLGQTILASRLTRDPERVNSVADLFEHVAKQAATSMLYSAEFAAGGVTERYLAAFRPEVAAALAQPLRRGLGAGGESLKLIPRRVESFTILDVDSAGDLPERVLKQLSPHIDVVAAVALREFIIGFRKQLGLEPSDALGGAVGDEIGFVRFDAAAPAAMLVRVNDRGRLMPVIGRYLAHGGSSFATDQYNGTAILVSSNEDGRAAAFVGDFLILGTRPQIVEVIEAQEKGAVLMGDERVQRALARRPANASIISCRPNAEDAGDLMLALSKLTRVTDGSRELLQRDSTHVALDHLPPPVGFTEFRDYGAYYETQSPVGSFSLLAALILGTEDNS